MPKMKGVREIDLNDLVIGKGQVRVKDVQKGVDDLAGSMRVQGLLQPIVVSESEKGKYEILTGQRRFLAAKQLKWKTIAAVVIGDHVDEATAKTISLTENLVRRDISQKEKIDACTALFKKYGSIKAVVETTGLPSSDVSHYVKYDRLIPKLKQMVDSGEIHIKVALKAQDAAAPEGEEPKPTDAVKLAKELATMTGAQQSKLMKERAADPEMPVDQMIEVAKTGARVTQVIVTLTTDVHNSLQNFAANEGTTQDDAAATLIEEGLTSKGFGA